MPVRVLVAIALLAGDAMGQEGRQVVPGTGVSMVPPTAFKLAHDFAGFIEPSTAASFIITPLPQDMAMEIASAFRRLDLARELLAENTGIVATGRAEITGMAGSTAVISGTQTTDDRTDRKWIAVITDEQSVMVTVSLPPKAEVGEPSILAALASLNVNELPPLDDQIAALPFAVTPAAPFEFDSTVGAVAAKLRASRSVILITSILRHHREEDLRTTAEQMFRRYGTTQTIRSDEVTFVGRRGWLIDATSTEGGPEPQTRWLQWFSLGERQHIMLSAFGPNNEIDTLRPAIEQVAASVEWKSGERP